MSASNLPRRLRQTQSQANDLWLRTQELGLLTWGKTEKALSDEIMILAKKEFGVKKYWHKRIVRSGPNTLEEYSKNLPDRLIQPDDILFVDFGPVFSLEEGQFEADYGRTISLNQSNSHQRLILDLDVLFQLGKEYYCSNPSMTGADLRQFMTHQAQCRGYALAATHCGHIIGEFPHEKRLGDGHYQYICSENTIPMNAPDCEGHPRYWVLEVHLIEPSGRFGGFYEDLLDV